MQMPRCQVQVPRCQVKTATKGAPVHKSHTGTQLVSPVTGCKKKKKPLWDMALEHEIQYIPIYYKYIIYVQITHVLVQLKERPKTTEKVMREGLVVAWILKVNDSGVIMSILN
jgi:hypothetical protein